jgi:RNA polymerase sigma-70 factor (ECF subfamily)
MTQGDKHRSGCCDDEADYATAEEVAAELARLSQSPPELGKIELRARTLSRGTTMDPGELINTVVERLLIRCGRHGRHWHRKEALADCFYRTMKSIVRDYWRRQKTPMVAVSAGAAGLQTDPDPELQLIARDELQELLKALDDANDTAAIALAIASGSSPAEIRRRFGLSETDYDTALKRIRRKILKHKTSGGQP